VVVLAVRARGIGATTAICICGQLCPAGSRCRFQTPDRLSLAWKSSSWANSNYSVKLRHFWMGALANRAGERVAALTLRMNLAAAVQAIRSPACVYRRFFPADWSLRFSARWFLLKKTIPAQPVGSFLGTGSAAAFSEGIQVVEPASRLTE